MKEKRCGETHATRSEHRLCKRLDMIVNARSAHPPDEIELERHEKNGSNAVAERNPLQAVRDRKRGDENGCREDRAGRNAAAIECVLLLPAKQA